MLFIQTILHIRLTYAELEFYKYLQAIALRKDPEGETVFPPTNEPPIGLGTCDEIKEIATLQRKVKTLQAQLTFHNDVSSCTYSSIAVVSTLINSAT